MNPGDTISRYRIVGRIGKGGMGVVYRAEDTRLRRPVALKFLPQESLNESAKYRFLNEARAAALARHPNICPIHDIEEADGELFIVMAFIEGETLSRRIARGPLDPAEAADIAAQVAGGLASAHQLGIVHRDIKSSNIMIDPSGHASIMDFGLALAPEALRLTGEGASVGTPDYMSPEQAMGKAVDARTDVWSLGVVLFEMLTGALPFRREHRAALVHAILSDPAPDVADACPGVPEELRQIVGRALVKDPAGRWQTAAAMQAALKRAQGVSASASAERTDTQTIAVAASRPRRRRLLAAAAIGAALLLGAGGAALYRSRQSTPPAAVPAVKQIAILPLQADAVPAIANGMEEVLATALAGHVGVYVTPSADLRRRGITTLEAARKFYNATLALTGSAKPVGDDVEFTIHLADTSTGSAVATQTFLFDPKDPLVSRDQAVGKVFRMLGLDPPATARPASETAAPDAYSAYLEGRGFLARYDVPGNIDKAIASLTRATKQDSKYALAYAGLGEAYWRKTRATRDAQWATLANQNAEYATQLAPDLAIAHSVLGSVYRDAGREEDAIRELQRAIDLAPGNAEAPRQLAEVYKNLGRFQEAETLYRRSTQSRPTDWYGRLLLGMFYYERERYNEAESELKEAKNLAPDNDMVRIDLGAVYRMHGRYKEAIEEYQQALRIRSNANTYAALGGAYFYEHRFAEAVSATEAAIDLDSSDYRYWGNLGAYYKWTPGQESKSAPALRRALELAAKAAETRKSDYTVYANMAEYRARLGDTKGALAEIELIPPAARGPFTTRLAIVYELAGMRDKAIAMIRANFKSPASLRQIQDHPDLTAVWRAGGFR